MQGVQQRMNLPVVPDLSVRPVGDPSAVIAGRMEGGPGVLAHAFPAGFEHEKEGVEARGQAVEGSTGDEDLGGEG